MWDLFYASHHQWWLVVHRILPRSAVVLWGICWKWKEKKEDSNVIKVIGSHIKRIKDNDALPVTNLTAEDIEDSGAATGDELLRNIPQVGEVAFNNERAIGGVNDARGDVNSINLRGLGTGNTLTLLNGRRLVLHPGTQSENFVPVTKPFSVCNTRDPMS